MQIRAMCVQDAPADLSLGRVNIEAVAAHQAIPMPMIVVRVLH
jgi:hypothetical protein